MKKYDYTAVYQKNLAFLEKLPVFKKALLPFSHVVTALCAVAYAFLIYTAFSKKFTADTLIRVLGAPVLCLLLVMLLRYAVARPRPYAEDGANIQPISKKKQGINNSFPSRHVACAFVIATLFLPFFTWVAVSLYAVSVLLAYARFALGLHYPSDLIGGAILGVLCGALIFI